MRLLQARTPGKLPICGALRFVVPALGISDTSVAMSRPGAARGAWSLNAPFRDFDEGQLLLMPKDRTGPKLAIRSLVGTVLRARQGCMARMRSMRMASR